MDKPELQILELIELIKSDKSSYAMNFSEGEVFDMRFNDISSIICILSGSVSIHRKIDDVLIVGRHAPTIIGLTQIFSTTNYHYIRCNTACSVTVLTSENARALFSMNNGWENVSYLLAYISNLYYIRDKLISGGSVYEITKSHLEYIWGFDESTRNKISIYDFITKRNHISRSSLHKIIKELIKGGYIITDKGRLVYLKDLPNKF